MKKITQAKLKDLLQQASTSPRLRSHYNLHEELSDSVNRLCITLKKGTYIRPHRHSESYKWKLILAHKGKIAILIYDDEGAVTDKFIISTDGEICAFEMRPNTWHSLYPITDEAVFFEVKPGPFIATQEDDFAAWAPKEGGELVGKFLDWSVIAKSGDAFYA